MSQDSFYFCAMEISISNVKEALKKVIEPDLKKDIITLDLVSDIKIEDGAKIGDIADILMTELQEKHPVLFNVKHYIL